MDNANNTGSDKSKLFWRSIGDYNNNPKYIELKQHEFPDGVSETIDIKSMSPLSRRKFIALLSATAAFAATGCKDYPDKGEIVPYNNQPEEITLGKANYYASTYSDGSGILIKTREGRPVKVDGNPDHPVNSGHISAASQAGILNLYDPERLREPAIVKNGKLIKESWNNIDSEIIKALESATDKGKEIAIVTNSIKSPSLSRLLKDFIEKYPVAKAYTYDLFNSDNKDKAWELSYGSGKFPGVSIDKANVILALESDFLHSDENAIGNMKMFSRRRDVDSPTEFSRLYCVEGPMSLTGANADYRFRLSPEYQLEFVLSLLNETLFKGRSNLLLGFQVEGLLTKYSLKAFSEKHDIPLNKLKGLVNDLVKNVASSIVIAGDSLPVEVHIAVNLLNEALGNTKLYMNDSLPVVHFENEPGSDIGNLVRKMNAGNIEILIHLDSNPVYHLPLDYGYSGALSKVPFVVSLTSSENESSELSKYILSINHDFESWGDFQLRNSYLSVQQPVIAPLYNTRQKEAVLLNWINGNKNYSEDIYHKYLMNRWQNEVFPQFNSAVSFKKFWLSAVHDGVINLKTMPLDIPKFEESALDNLNKNYNKSGFTLVLMKSASIGDGKYSNNGWLQELPHPVSKVVWDNYAAIAPATAKELKLSNDDMIEVESSGKKLELPVLIQPGMAEKLIAVELGYGRTKAGTIGTGTGFNAGLLMTKSSGISNWIYTGATVKITGNKHQLVSTQEHHALDDEFVKEIHLKRDLVKEGTVEDFIKHPEFLKEHGHDFLYDENHEVNSITENREYTGVKWGMAFDLNKCTGCGACIAACNVENNIPVVGKEQCSNGREMHWIRLDRYYSGTPENPVVSNQHQLCQHCDNAPCENVCPVVATTHSDDGLNQMAYNRCVGTRYCANNCPYKVRRFNFFDFRENLEDGYFQQDSLQLLHNPEVTVRSRGVMEKCTFCIQRIMEAREEATKDGRKLKGSDVETACQQACPAEAIVFGDLNDKDSKVSRLRDHKLGYHVLELLNVRPNITYIAKLRNTHSEEI